jgi:hypothetical protein
MGPESFAAPPPPTPTRTTPRSAGCTEYRAAGMAGGPAHFQARQRDGHLRDRSKGLLEPAHGELGIANKVAAAVLAFHPLPVPPDTWPAARST